jgi:hypothetical protein
MTFKQWVALTWLVLFSVSVIAFFALAMITVPEFCFAVCSVGGGVLILSITSWAAFTIGEALRR